MNRFLVEQGGALASDALTHLRKAQGSPGIRQIHALRVAIKRMRALVTIVHALRPEAKRPRRALHHWKRMFRVIGELREQQVCAQMVRRMRGIPAEHRQAYLRHASEQADRLTAEAVDLMRGMSARDGERIRRYVEKAVADADDRALMKHLNAALRSGWQDARRAMRSRSCDLHALRKQVKRVWYILRLLEKAERPLPKGIPARSLGELQRVLGEWHDARVLVDDVGAWHGGGIAQRALMIAALHIQSNVQEMVERTTERLSSMAHGPGRSSS
ncbi:MAG: CHAD domain-containing protein [Flavobacteriales bacterium]|nr:CHAD domain-containing protein [Flavobacteriales bacterium]